VVKAPSVGKLTGELRFVGALHSNLDTLVRSAAVQRGLRCGPITFPSYRGVPDTRWLLDLPQKRVGARSARRRPYGVEVFVLGEKALRRYGFAQGASPRTNVPDPGYVPVARTPRFSAYARCPAGR
jgi:hypothetical protein